ncbi:MAG: class II aldolase/adducin family protein [Pseudomonadota bacterium]
MSNIEQDLREKLAATHHVIHYNGWDDLLATHISVRVPDTDHILITPMDVAFECVSASKLIKCDLSGNIISDNGQALMPQAINIHGELYKRTNIMSAIHTHSLYGSAVSALEEGLLFLTQESLRFYNDVAYCDYGGLALENEGKRIAAVLEHERVAILRNHGLLSTGRSIEEALYLHYYLEFACELQIKIMATNSKLVPISEAMCQQTKAQFDSILTPEYEFNALVQRIEGLSEVDYRE